MTQPVGGGFSREPFFVVIQSKWLHGEASHVKRLKRQGLCPIGSKPGYLTPGCQLLVKYLTEESKILIDESAQLTKYKGKFYIRSQALCRQLSRESEASGLLAFYFEGAAGDARCIGQSWDTDFLSSIEAEEPTLRLSAYDLPPGTTTIVDSRSVVETLYRLASTEATDLFAVHTSRFLDTPHILKRLFSHVLTLSSEDHIKFPVQLQKIAEHMRERILQRDTRLEIKKIERSHLELWADAEGLRFAYLDGGVARIGGLAGLEPLALRVGVYSVTPGVVDADERERFAMYPYVVGDLIDRSNSSGDADNKRLLEAARYTLEPFTGIEHLRRHPDTSHLVLHGPLVNQFAQYDEGPPNYIPFVDPKFLDDFEIDADKVMQRVRDIPSDPEDRPCWNQFMALYGFVMHSIAGCDKPIVGVIERSGGRAVFNAVLAQLREDGVISKPYEKKVQEILSRYKFSDDFLFGCLLKDGEYVSPIPIEKNLERRARERWQPVVRQYLRPSATMLKTDSALFPFRVEMNPAATEEADFVLRLLYHTARLLPRYAFPVGLDIADKYAKIPDWISRGVSDQMKAAIMRQAVQTDDSAIVVQVRHLLAAGPRDFFYRPRADMRRR